MYGLTNHLKFSTSWIESNCILIIYHLEMFDSNELPCLLLFKGWSPEELDFVQSKNYNWYLNSVSCSFKRVLIAMKWENRYINDGYWPEQINPRATNASKMTRCSVKTEHLSWDIIMNVFSCIWRRNVSRKQRIDVL